ncbi:DUF5518 domain-containing protein [Halomarina ordinaria]|uniref:DUF5518 domain-containing protein n=1 Tax=Halomarina ordinaria TaxID=3033939 RepID=A0ABD5UDM1_9EURY|nr:DUF5518 domain-containing protein [Halomarina sp. PSRA2]
MVNWRAVLIGFGIELVLGIVGFAVPILGHLTAAIVGGFAAGYIARGGVGNGAWHGLLAGAFGGLVIALVVGIGGSALLAVFGGPGGLLGGLGITAVAVVLWFVLSIPSAVGGALGAALA